MVLGSQKKREGADSRASKLWACGYGSSYAMLALDYI